MPQSKKLQNKISKKLDQLKELINEIIEVQVINSDDPETWDSDTLNNLSEKLKDTIKLLEDQKIKGKYDEFGQPLTEDGLCSLVDEWHSDEENSDF